MDTDRIGGDQKARLLKQNSIPDTQICHLLEETVLWDKQLEINKIRDSETIALGLGPSYRQTGRNPEMPVRSGFEQVATLSPSYSKHLFHAPHYLCRLPIDVITVILLSTGKFRLEKLHQPLKLTTPRSTCRPFTAVTLASNFSREDWP